MIHISDLRDPDDIQGRNYRQVNASKVHTIPIGALVEMSNGSRAFIVWHGRDCDQTPLYYVSLDCEDTIENRPGWKNPGWRGGYSEKSFIIIHEVPCPARPNA